MLDFDWITPRWKLADILRWQVPLPKYADLRATTIGLRHKGEHLIKAMCPPNYATMADAVDAVVAEKFGPQGIYPDEALFARIYRGEFGAQYLRQASNYSADVIALRPGHLHLHLRDPWAVPRALRRHPCAGRVAPGPPRRGRYYQQYFRHGLTEEHQMHDQRWHTATSLG